MAAVIEVAGLTKRYGGQAVVDGISFHVDRGEIFGILGPNGAGKTTAVECMEGLRRRDSGQVRILGLDPRSDGHRLHQRIGVQLQETQLPDKLKVREALEMYASFYPDPADWRELLERWGLASQSRAPFAKLSGGQKQRLFIALALVGHPELVFLDELTAGLDPGARRATWKLISQVRDGGVTVVLVSHFMDEVEELCDRVAILDRGRIAALDTPGAAPGGRSDPAASGPGSAGQRGQARRRLPGRRHALLHGRRGDSRCARRRRRVRRVRTLRAKPGRRWIRPDRDAAAGRPAGRAARDRIRTRVGHGRVGEPARHTLGRVQVTIRLLIADDHPVVRDGLRGIFEASGEFEVAGEAANGQEAVDRTAALRPDVVLMDLRMPVLDGVSAIRLLAERGVARGSSC